MDKKGFTLLEVIIIILIIAIIAVAVIPKFIDLRENAREAANQGNIAGLRSAVGIYYAKTALSSYSHLCTAEGNPYRNVTVSSPCFPASVEELEQQLVSLPQWQGSGGECYDSETGKVTLCQ
ncbi:MAG: prepilin-type N-terminal cleavage/methylation domain-containing protein [Candidatus Omnitrophica bacterium]|nr:prepilin-type N-terminal cleavage/methylation domain-containing protein [Candidatus Omnitrophota bacterium]MBU1523560.1 prepilin-type N-terminal cleavage/methylation domain-containing protein [Candidatus Omnitrophota bacterium]